MGRQKAQREQGEQEEMRKKKGEVGEEKDAECGKREDRWREVGIRGKRRERMAGVVGKQRRSQRACRDHLIFSLQMKKLRPGKGE